MVNVKFFLLVLLNSYLWGNLLVQDCFYNDGQLVRPAIAISLDEAPHLPDIYRGVGKGKERFLYQDFERVYGHPYVPRDQGDSPSCVGQSAACAVDILGAVETVAGHRNLPPPERASASWLYGASREFGGIQGRGGGSYCRLAVRAMAEMGFLYEDDFWLLGYDLTGDNPDRDRDFGNFLPPELKPFANQYITGYYQLNDYNDVRDAICSNMTVVVGSSVGFGNAEIASRDKDGFLRHPRLWFRGKYWSHAMAFTAVSDVKRKGVLCQNSWGSLWVDGPQRVGDEPQGSFWIDARIVNEMCRAGDCFAIYGLRSE